MLRGANVVRVGLVSAGVVASAAAGCSTGPSPGEAAVCAKLQATIRELERGDRGAALREFTELAGAGEASGNATMLRESRALFDLLSRPVDGYENMTVQQTVEFANRALEESASHLNALVDECALVGDPVEMGTAGTLGNRS